MKQAIAMIKGGKVAPLAGAGIEIRKDLRKRYDSKSPLSQGRELKSIVTVGKIAVYKVAPLAGAGIEII